MKDILLQHKDKYIECVIDGLSLTFTYSDDNKYHYLVTLHNENSYNELKRVINEEYERYEDRNEGYEMASELLHTTDMNEYFSDRYVYHDLRERDEIHKYLDEAWDKVWLMRSCVISRKEAVNAAGLAGIERIFKTYDDIPEEGYTDWECGYWNGILGALRWVLGSEKDFLDT